MKPIEEPIDGEDESGSGGIEPLSQIALTKGELTLRLRRLVVISACDSVLIVASGALTLIKILF